MATKSKTTGVSKRTKVKSLPKGEKKMTGKAMKKVRGGLDLTSSVDAEEIRKGTLIVRKMY